MWTNTKNISAGDLAIAWLTRDVIQPFVVTPGKDLNSRYGYYRHSDLIGQPYGSKIGSRNGKGFIHILKPTPELWTLALPHRTQILYLADIAFITSWLNIRPGSVVIEAGTGSGSFTHSVTRTVGPSGKVYSYEFHEARASKARDEFERHGMTDVVTLTHRNVCKDGFTIKDAADAVFLDLPAPWDAVGFAKDSLRKDRTTRICCFSPCMEQVLRTVASLNEAGFTDIAMYETLLRPHEVNQLPAMPSVASASEKVKKSERKREDKRHRQIAQSRAKHAEKRKRADDEVTADDADRKKAKTAEEVDVAVDLSQAMQADAAAIGSANAPIAMQDTASGLTESAAPTSSYSGVPPNGAPVDDIPPQVVSRVVPEVRGHTSYLTFALLLPCISSAAGAAAESTPAREQSDASSTSAKILEVPLPDTDMQDTST